VSPFPFITLALIALASYLFVVTVMAIWPWLLGAVGAFCLFWFVAAFAYSRPYKP